MARSIPEYMEERERECKALSLFHNEPPTYALEKGSDAKRGRIMMVLNMTDRAYLAVHEVVEVRTNHVHRIEYAYYLILDEHEFWSRDYDRIHGYHGHTPDHKERVEAERISFKAAAEEAWEIVSKEEELTEAPAPESL